MSTVYYMDENGFVDCLAGWVKAVPIEFLRKEFPGITPQQAVKYAIQEGDLVEVIWDAKHQKWTDELI